MKLRTDGLSLQKIANALNDAAVPTARAGKGWYPSTVDQVLKSAERAA